MKKKDPGSILQTVLSILRYVLLIILLWKLSLLRYNLGRNDLDKIETPEELSPDFRKEIKFMMNKNEAALKDFNSNMNITNIPESEQREIILRMELWSKSADIYIHGIQYLRYRRSASGI